MDAGMKVQSSVDPLRYPTLTEHGQRILRFMREHPAAPIYRNKSGNRLMAAEVTELQLFEKKNINAAINCFPDKKPSWLDNFLAHVFTQVPYYRGLGRSSSLRFEDLPTVSRADFASDITRFVPDSVTLDRLIQFSTTGTTGHPLRVPSHPVVAGRYLTFHKRALKRFGIELQYGRGQVGVVLVGYQRRCFTYVSVTPTMDESGLAKINLHPDDWRDPADRVCYLEALAPEIITGDPLSLTELARLSLKTRPRALLSVSMALSEGLRQMLEKRFECPVLDIYSLNEVGPVAVLDPKLQGHVLLQPQLYVEILDPQGKPLQSGERGEITVTGGFNFCLPLLRYRTGDYASLSTDGEEPILIGLAGRPPVRFRTKTGEWINNIEITHALKLLPLAQYGFHQLADGSCVLRLHAMSMHLASCARQALIPLFGNDAISLELLIAQDKIIQYSSDLEQASV
ncbi:MAG: AMP-binding protein [Burkholderiaceae bacterium]|nr:AMP-binding protein [Burkholderiaceae bacterium]